VMFLPDSDRVSVCQVPGANGTVPVASGLALAGFMSRCPDVVFAAAPPRWRPSV
jgi:hypothetical protein